MLAFWAVPAHSQPTPEPIDPATRVGIKMMPSTGTHGGDFLASDGYASFMTTPFGHISLCSDVGFTFNPDDAQLDPARGPYLASGVLDFSGWGFMYPWYGLACGDQVALFQGAVDDPNGFALNFDSLGPADIILDEFRGPQRATRHSEFRLPGLDGVLVSLDQTASCASLEKVFAFTNAGDDNVTFRMNTTMDTDLQWGTQAGWGQWGYCHNVGRFVAPNEVRTYSRDRDIWTTIRVRRPRARRRRPRVRRLPRLGQRLYGRRRRARLRAESPWAAAEYPERVGELDCEVLTVCSEPLEIPGHVGE